MKTRRVSYLGNVVEMAKARADDLIARGQARPAKAPETAAARPPRNAAKPRAGTRKATRKPRGK